MQAKSLKNAALVVLKTFGYAKWRKGHCSQGPRFEA